MMSPRRTYAFVTAVLTGVTVTLAAQAQVSPSIGISLTELLAGPDVSTTEVPLTNSFQPSTPWPLETTISQTVLQSPHDLLAYTGVEEATRKLLGDDFATWRSQFASKPETEILPQGLLMSSGCLNPCDMHKSLLMVDPSDQKVYAAMVAQGRVTMRPSLMTWPDDAIPSLKNWLASATDGDAEK